MVKVTPKVLDGKTIICCRCHEVIDLNKGNPVFDYAASVDAWKSNLFQPDKSRGNDLDILHSAWDAWYNENIKYHCPRHLCSFEAKTAEEQKLAEEATKHPNTKSVKISLNAMARDVVENGLGIAREEKIYHKLCKLFCSSWTALYKRTKADNVDIIARTSFSGLHPQFVAESAKILSIPPEEVARHLDLLEELQNYYRRYGKKINDDGTIDIEIPVVKIEGWGADVTGS